MASQLEADLAAMETEEEPIVDALADVEMAEQEMLLCRMLHPLPAKKKFQFLRQRFLLERIPNVMLSISLRNLLSTMKLLVLQV